MNKKIDEKKVSICNCVNLRRAAQAITEIYDKFLDSSGLKISQYLLLKHVNRLGPVSVSRLALEIRLDRTTIVRNLKPMEDKGFIKDVAKKGTRNRQLMLTDKGLEIFEVVEPLWVEAQNFIQRKLGKDDINTLTVLLSKIEALVP